MNNLLPEYFKFSTDGENKFYAKLQKNSKFQVRDGMKFDKFYTYDEVLQFIKNKEWIIIW